MQDKVFSRAQVTLHQQIPCLSFLMFFLSSSLKNVLHSKGHQFLQKNFNISSPTPPGLTLLSWIGMPFPLLVHYLIVLQFKGHSPVETLLSAAISPPVMGGTPAFTPHAHLYPVLNSHFVKIGWLACLPPTLGCKHDEKVVFFKSIFQSSFHGEVVFKQYSR